MYVNIQHSPIYLLLLLMFLSFLFLTPKQDKFFVQANEQNP